VEINSPNTGIIYKIFVKEGETVPVNTVIAILVKEGEEISSESIKSFLRNQEGEGVSFKEEKIKIAPIARKLALAKGVDLSLINGSGPGGAITKKDIEEYLSKKGKKTNFTIKEVYKLTEVQKITPEGLLIVIKIFLNLPFAGR